MNEKQQKLIDYFNSLSDPAPPLAVSFAGGLEEAAPAESSLTVPPAATQESILKRLEQRLAPAAPELATEGDDGQTLGGGTDLTDVSGFPTDSSGWVNLWRSRPPSERTIPPNVLDIAAETIDKAHKGEDLSPEGEVILEQLILPGQRPVLDVIAGEMSTPPAGWERLDGYRAQIRTFLPSIGRIDLPWLRTVPYAGTGFVVGPDLLLTNRHVAAHFVSGVGSGANFLSFRSGVGPRFDPKYEVGDPEPGSGTERFEVTEALLVHPHWDAAILRVRAMDGATLPPALSLARRPPPFFGRGARVNVVVIGYPEFDTRSGISNVAEQVNVFRGIFGRKRIAPGFLKGFATAISMYDISVQAAEHDSSTLGGNSGSAIIDLTSGLVVALHFGGEYLRANYGVPSWELALDPRVVDLGVSFADQPGPPPADPAPAAPAWLTAWDGVRPLAPNVV